MSDNIQPSDIIYAASKAALGSIPGLGPVASEFFGLFFSSPLEKRKQEWFEQIALEIVELKNQQPIKFENLQENHQFIDTLIRATSIAIKTSEVEKRQALKNAIFNTALSESMDTLENHIFLDLIEKLSGTHLKILLFFREPNIALKNASIEITGIITSSHLKLFKQLFPELESRSDILRLVCSDLHNAGLISINDIEVNMMKDELLRKGATTLGERFITYISSDSVPKSPRHM